MNAQFCAICVDGTDELELEDLDGRRVFVCARCRDEHPCSGGYTFASHREHGVRLLAGGKMNADGNRRVPARGTSIGARIAVRREP